MNSGPPLTSPFESTPPPPLQHALEDISFAAVSNVPKFEAKIEFQNPLALEFPTFSPFTQLLHLAPIISSLGLHASLVKC